MYIGVRIDDGLKSFQVMTMDLNPQREQVCHRVNQQPEEDFGILLDPTVVMIFGENLCLLVNAF